MSNCDNLRCLHLLSEHSRDTVNPNILHCNHKEYVNGPKGEHWKWKHCGATCIPQYPMVMTGYHYLDEAFVGSDVIFRTTADRYRVYKMELNSSVLDKKDGDSITYSISWTHPDSEVRSISIDVLNEQYKEYVDVLSPNSLVRVSISGSFTGKYKVWANVTKFVDDDFREVSK